jgi:hypothetical protein
MKTYTLTIEQFAKAMGFPSKDGIHCVLCRKVADKFRDELSVKEFGMSGLCQECQDDYFVTRDV